MANGSLGPRNWLVGKDLTLVQLSTGTYNVDGSVAWTTFGNLTATGTNGRCDYIRVGDDRQLELIVPVDAIFANWNLTILDSDLVVGEIITKVGTGGGDTYLAAIAQITQLVGVFFTRGGQSYTYYGTIQRFGDGVVALGKNTVEMTLKPIDLGVSPLQYTG